MAFHKAGDEISMKKFIRSWIIGILAFGIISLISCTIASNVCGIASEQIPKLVGFHMVVGGVTLMYGMLREMNIPFL